MTAARSFARLGLFFQGKGLADSFAEVSSALHVDVSRVTLSGTVQ
jgi:hypothetical protein